MDDAREIAGSLTWIESFTLRNIVNGRWLIPLLRFEMTSSERAAARRLCLIGLAKRTFCSWKLTPLGLRVRQVLQERQNGMAAD